LNAPATSPVVLAIHFHCADAAEQQINCIQHGSVVTGGHRTCDGELELELELGG